MSIKIPFNVKFGRNEIEIPCNTGKNIYCDYAEGLSPLNNLTFTLINQIPTSDTVATKIAWTKHVMQGCGKSSGIYDKSAGNMLYKANGFTAYLTEWRNYREPNFSKKGYYSVYDTEKELYTANVGDLLIFREIEESAPTSVREFNNLRAKYTSEGGVITGAEAFIEFKANGKPWRTNHIELIKG